MKNEMQFNPTYGPLVEVCRKFGIGRTKAFEYHKSGWLDTFLLGSKRYVYVESVETLPKRLGLS